MRLSTPGSSPRGAAGYGDLFHLTAPDLALHPMRLIGNEEDLVSFDQTYPGVPVFGARLTLTIVPPPATSGGPHHVALSCSRTPSPTTRRSPSTSTTRTSRTRTAGAVQRVLERPDRAAAVQAVYTDGDGVGGTCDNRPFAPNPGQEDRGGVGSGSRPNGRGDACKCGDVTGDGLVTLVDSVAIGRSLLAPPTATLARPALCDVAGSAACSTADAVAIRRALLVAADRDDPGEVRPGDALIARPRRTAPRSDPGVRGRRRGAAVPGGRWARAGPSRARLRPGDIFSAAPRRGALNPCRIQRRTDGEARPWSKSSGTTS